MSFESLREYLQETFYTKIPITREMEIRVLGYNGHDLMLGASLQPNVNDKGTAFGGSLFSLLVLTGWGLLHLKLKEEGIPGDVMVHESNITYSLPVTDDWKARCTLPSEEEYERFLNRLRAKGRARISLESRIMKGSRVAVNFQGKYATIGT